MNNYEVMKQIGTEEYKKNTNRKLFLHQRDPKLVEQEIKQVQDALIKVYRELVKEERKVFHVMVKSEYIEKLKIFLEPVVNVECMSKEDGEFYYHYIGALKKPNSDFYGLKKKYGIPAKAVKKRHLKTNLYKMCAVGYIQTRYVKIIKNEYEYINKYHYNHVNENTFMDVKERQAWYEIMAKGDEEIDEGYRYWLQEHEKKEEMTIKYLLWPTIDGYQEGVIKRIEAKKRKIISEVEKKEIQRKKQRMFGGYPVNYKQLNHCYYH